MIGVIAFAAIAAAAGWNYQQNKQSVELSDLALENVEALALGETDDEFYKKQVVMQYGKIDRVGEKTETLIHLLHLQDHK